MTRNNTIAAHQPPSFDIDPFDETAIEDPYAFHDALRDAGPVVRIEKYDLWAMARHAEVSAALKDWETFCSGRGVGLSDFAKEEPWRPPSLLLEVDPPLHDRTRSVVARVVSPQALKALRPEWETKAERIVAKLVAKERFDAIKELAEVYPIDVFPDAVGLPKTGRENLLPYGALGFNAFGPRNRIYKESAAAAAHTLEWVAQSCKRSALAAEGFGAGIFKAVDRGEVNEPEAERLVRSFIAAGVDTTINGIGNMIAAFAQHPEQFAMLRERPELIRVAFEEVLRWDSTVQTFFRTTTRDVEIGEFTIPEGSKVLLFLAAANRDPRQWENPELFDITRRATGHVGFGVGIHGCIGQMIARMEAELVLTALVKQVSTLEPDGAARRRLNNTLRAWETFPVRVTAA